MQRSVWLTTACMQIYEAAEMPSPLPSFGSVEQTPEAARLGGRILLEQAAMTIRLGENRESGYGAAKFILDPTNRSVQQS